MHDADRDFYRDEGSEDPRAYAERMCRKAEAYLDRAGGALRKHLPPAPRRLIEIGAGSCAMGLAVCKLLNVGEAVHADISRQRLERLYEHSSACLGYRPGKVSFIELDMNGPFDLPDASADVVLFDAALHHARNLWNCLGESFRVLRPGGWLAGLREQMCAPLRAGGHYRRLSGTREVRQGVSENSYLVQQYLFYLRAAGFEARAVPILEPGAGLAHRLLWFLNGWLFASFVLLARRPTENGRGPCERNVP